MDQYNYEGDREIDLVQLILVIWENINKIIIAGIMVAILLIGVKSIKIIPTIKGNGNYVGIAKIFIAKDVPNTVATAIRTYFTSNELLDKTIKDLNLNLTVNDVNSMISLNNSSTTLIVINVFGDNEAIVKDITDYLAVNGLKQIKNNFKYNSAMILEPAFTTVNSGIGWGSFIKKIIKYGLTGFLLGAGMLVCIYIFLFIHDSSIKDERDVHKYLGVPVLGIIPTIEGEKKNIDKNKRNRKLYLYQHTLKKVLKRRK